MKNISELERQELISVIIPVFQVEDYLERCLNSIINQTYKKLEIILVDDGSMDNSGRICDEYAKKDSRIRVIHKKNGGLSSARNAGLDIARGEYISFVDSDDWLEEDAIHYLYSLLHRLDADFSMGANIRSEEDIENDLIEQSFSQIDFLRIFFKVNTQENVQYAWAKLYKRNLFDEVRYPDGLTSEDIPTTFQVIIKSHKIAYSNKVVYHYFRNPQSITGVGFSKNTFDLFRVWDSVCSIANDKCSDEIKEMAVLNRRRMDFSVLVILAMSKYYKKNQREFSDEIENTLSELKRNLKYLLKERIPVSRKIVMIGLCYAHSFTMSAINFFYNIK